MLDLLGAVETEGERGSSYEIPVGSAIDMDAIAAYMGENEAVSSRMVLASMDVTATSPRMTASLNYEMDASDMEGGYVIFDLLTSGDEVTATHADPANEMESFEVEQPSLRTEATDAADGDHEILPSMDARMTDTVSYSGLVAGTEYVLTGLVVDKADGSQLHVDGKPVVAERSFVPDSPSGSVQVGFSFDSTGLEAGTELVVYEFLTQGGDDIAEHADPDDVAQTVVVGALPAGKGYYKTGAKEPDASPAMVATGAVAGAVLFLGSRRLMGGRRA